MSERTQHNKEPWRCRHCDTLIVVDDRDLALQVSHMKATTEPTVQVPLARLKELFLRLKVRYSCDRGEPNPTQPFRTHVEMKLGDYDWLNNLLRGAEEGQKL